MKFALTVVDEGRQLLALDLDGADEATVRDLAKARGYAVLTVRRKRLASLPAGEQRFPTVLFSIELLALLKAGLNVVEALQALAEKESGPEQERVLADLLEALQRGESLSQALARQPRWFSPLYVATVRSSERTGDVREALARYIAYQQEFDQLRKKLVAALLYPAILLVVGTGVLGFLLFYVVPRFARVYEDASIDLPFFSRMLLTVGGWIEQNGVATVLVLAGTMALAVYLLSQISFRAAILEWLYRSSGIGARMRVYQLGRFYRTLAMLSKAGVPVLKAFEMVATLLPPNMRGQLTTATKLVREGKALSAALMTAGLTTPVAARMAAVGDRSGQMAEMMDQIARFYDDETSRFVDSFTRIFEPLLMAALGLAVGAVVVLMYMPIFELAGSVR